MDDAFVALKSQFIGPNLQVSTYPPSLQPFNDPALIPVAVREYVEFRSDSRSESEELSESRSESRITQELTEVADDYVDDFVEDLNDPRCVQRIYDFALHQVRGMVDYNDEDDLIQDVFYRLTKWPINAKKYNSARHYFALLKITIRQSIAAYWKRRHSQRNDSRKRIFISQLERDSEKRYEFADASQDSDNVLAKLEIKELAKKVLAKAESMPENHKTMFRLRFVDEKSHEEISQHLGISIRTSYRLETKVRTMLRAHFVGHDR